MDYSSQKVLEIVEDFTKSYSPFQKVKGVKNKSGLLTSSVVHKIYASKYPASVIEKSIVTLNNISRQWIAKNPSESSLEIMTEWVIKNYQPLFEDNLYSIELDEILDKKFGTKYSSKDIEKAYGVLSLRSDKWLHKEKVRKVKIEKHDTENIKFLAIDFETASYERHSACALALVKVENNKIIERHYYLIKPPSSKFTFTYLHRINWQHVQNAPNFKDLWSRINYLFNDIDFVVAHNISFDKSVLKACCEYYNILMPKVDYRCTVKISREMWNIKPTKLNDVCSHFNIPLKHHDAGSDTLACAKIMILSLDKSYHAKNINSLQLPLEKINKALLNWRNESKQVEKTEVKREPISPKIHSNVKLPSSKKTLNQNTPKSYVKEEDSCLMSFIKAAALLLFLYIMVKSCGPFEGPWQRNKIPNYKKINQINYLNQSRLNLESYINLELLS